MKEIAFYVTKYMALADTDPNSEENELQTDKSRELKHLASGERRLKGDQAHMPPITEQTGKYCHWY